MIKKKFQNKTPTCFRISEFLVPAVIAGITSILAISFVPKETPMVLAMGIGMIGAMAAQVLVLVFFMPLFGTFEIMIPSMTAGMASGMFTGMLSARFGLNLLHGFLFGAGLGLVICIWIQARNVELRGDVK